MSRVEAELRDNLHDTALWEVYGDELQERGDPRGEMIAWSVSLVRNPSAATAEEIRKWLHSHVTWAEPVSQDCLEAVREPLQRCNLIRVELSMGHAQHLRLTSHGRKSEVGAWWADHLSLAAGDPLVQFVGSAHFELGSSAATDAFCASTWPIRALTVWANWRALPAPADLAGACPRLEALSLDGPVESTTRLVHTDLSRIAWTLGDSGDFDDEDDEDDVEIDAGEGAWLLDANLPALRELIVDRRLPDAVQEALSAKYGPVLRSVPGRDRVSHVAHSAG